MSSFGVNAAVGKTPLPKEDWPKCKKILENIEADPLSDPFREPVAWEELKLFDYPKIVQRPMDFSTLKTNLMNGMFGTYEEFLADLQLIWDNCKLYNMAGSEIYKMAERQEKLTRRELQKFKQQYGLTTLVIPTSNNTRPTVAPRASKRTAS